MDAPNATAASLSQVADAKAGATASPPPKPKPVSVVVDKVADDQICVRLLLISGLKTDLLFGPTDSIESVKLRIFSAWPSDWTGETPETAANLRVLLRGKFLEPSTTLADAKFPLGQTTTCHLLIKNGPITDNPQPTPSTGKSTRGGGAGSGAAPAAAATNGAAGQPETTGCRCTIL
ncbi:hypothetical protein HDU79_007646 [Rhizoclosmatium sp. JEL0117]|nr:hypothetical protein HDU79_007646 [Rhizoclosmatium sp. JEL0117]